MGPLCTRASGGAGAQVFMRNQRSLARCFFFSSRRRHTRYIGDWSSDVCSSDLALIATGEHKAAIVRRAVEGEPSQDVAATYLQGHANATAYLDLAAAAELTRVKTQIGRASCRESVESGG